jgi:hypothetical protein
LQYEHAPRGFVLGPACTFGEDGLAQPRRQALVPALFLGEIAEQLAGRRVRGPLGRLGVIARVFVLHLLGVIAHLVEAERPHQPQWWVRDEAFDVLAADQRQVFAEPLAVEFDQPAPVPGFLLGHLVEYLG